MAHSLDRGWNPYFRLGINHHLLFPAAFESVETHRLTLPRVLALPHFEVVDMFLLTDGEALEDETARVRGAGREAVYNCPLFLSADLNPHAMDGETRKRALAAAKEHADRAKKLQAAKMVVASGIDPGPALRKRQTDYFADYLEALCRYAGPRLELLIEPFDRSIGKCLLIGPTVEAVRVVEEVRNAFNS